MGDPKRIEELFQRLEEKMIKRRDSNNGTGMKSRITGLFCFFFSLCHAFKDLSIHFDGHGKNGSMRWSGLRNKFVFNRWFQFV